MEARCWYSQVFGGILPAVVLICASCSDTPSEIETEHTGDESIEVGDFGGEDSLTGDAGDVATDSLGDVARDSVGDVSEDRHRDDQADRTTDQPEELLDGATPDEGASDADVPDEDTRPLECPRRPPAVPEGEVCETDCPAYGSYLTMDPGSNWTFTLDTSEDGASLQISFTEQCAYQLEGGTHYLSAGGTYDVTLVAGPDDGPAGVWLAEDDNVTGEMAPQEDCGTYTGELVVTWGGMDPFMRWVTCQWGFGVTIFRDRGAPTLEGPFQIVATEGQYTEVAYEAAFPDCRDNRNVFSGNLPDFAQLDTTIPESPRLRLFPDYSSSGVYEFGLQAQELIGSTDVDASAVLIGRIVVQEDEPGGCATSSDCPDCSICRRETCLPRWGCEDEYDCPTGSFCVDEICEPTCTHHGECAAGRACVDSTCKPHPACGDSRDCHEGEACREASCDEVECDEHDDCEGFEVCFANTCQHLTCDEGCGEDLACVKSLEGVEHCAPRCTDDDECPIRTSYCFDGACIESASCEGVRCEGPSEGCEFCIGGICHGQCAGDSCYTGDQTRCFDESDCAEGNHCLAGTAVAWCVNQAIHRCQDGCPSGTTCNPIADICVCDGGVEGECGGARDHCQAFLPSIVICVDGSNPQGVCPPASACREDDLRCEPPAFEVPRLPSCVGGCDEGHSCDPAPGACDSENSPPGVCRRIPNECPDESDPVCACGTVTVENDCRRRALDVGLAHTGVCE